MSLKCWLDSQMKEIQGASKEGFWGRGQRLGSYLQRVEAGIWQKR